MVPGWLLAIVTGAICVALAVVARTKRHRVIAHFENDVAERRSIDSNGIVVGAEPFLMKGSERSAVLFVHGFGDTPQSIMPVASALHQAGWTVRGMLLPGHGRSVREYARAREKDWSAAMQQEYAALRAHYEIVVLCGISMGAALSVMLAESHPEIPSIVLLAPYFVMRPVMRLKTATARIFAYVFPYHPNVGSNMSIQDPQARVKSIGMGVVPASLLTQLRNVAAHARRALPNLKARVLYLQSREDNRLDVNDAVEQFARIGSIVKEQRWLTGCGHIITVDYCKDEVSRQAVAWFAPDLR